MCACLGVCGGGGGGGGNEKGRTERDTNAFTEKGDQEYV